MPGNGLLPVIFLWKSFLSTIYADHLTYVWYCRCFSTFLCCMLELWDDLRATIEPALTLAQAIVDSDVAYFLLGGVSGANISIAILFWCRGYFDHY